MQVGRGELGRLSRPHLLHGGQGPAPGGTPVGGAERHGPGYLAAPVGRETLDALAEVAKAEALDLAGQMLSDRPGAEKEWQADDAVCEEQPSASSGLRGVAIMEDDEEWGGEEQDDNEAERHGGFTDAEKFDTAWE